MLSWIKDNKYYNLQVQKNFFGTNSVICSWASINTKHNGYKIIICNNDIELQDTISSITKRRKARGYSVVEKKLDRYFIFYLDRAEVRNIICLINYMNSNTLLLFI